MSPWLAAIRLRTLPLALSSIAMGGFLAANAGNFNGSVFFMCCLTTVLLQVLSNLANDYGDSVHGADHAGRKGPQRAVQSGSISKRQMKRAVILLSVLSFVSGVLLLWFSLEGNQQDLLVFLSLGIMCIAAAISYTMGKKPYGYAGLGDVSVLVFFGLVGVMGSHYLISKSFDWMHIFPALSCGVFAVGVLNLNNMRDIESDLAAGKYSVPVRIGKQNAAYYHVALLAVGMFSAALFMLLNYRSAWQWLFLLVTPLLFKVGKAVLVEPSERLDPWLKRMALTTLAFVILFGLGLLLSQQ